MKLFVVRTDHRPMTSSLPDKTVPVTQTTALITMMLLGIAKQTLMPQGRRLLVPGSPGIVDFGVLAGRSNVSMSSNTSPSDCTIGV